MPKAGAKRKKAEKAKVQFKTSLKGQKTKPVKLPKGQNETKINLQIKTLVVQGRKGIEAAEQEEEEKARLLEGAKRLRPIKDLLSKVQHHTQASRSEGLKGLKDWIKYRLDEFETTLALIINKVMGLLSDREKAIRKEFCEFFGYLLASVSPVT